MQPRQCVHDIAVCQVKTELPGHVRELSCCPHSTARGVLRARVPGTLLGMPLMTTPAKPSTAHNRSWSDGGPSCVLLSAATIVQNQRSLTLQPVHDLLHQWQVSVDASESGIQPSSRCGKQAPHHTLSCSKPQLQKTWQHAADKVCQSQCEALLCS